MAAYQGGKKFLGKKIASRIHDIESEIGGGAVKRTYIEPFCGMCSVLRYFSRAGDRKVLAYDLNEDLILLLTAVQNGWKPPLNATQDDYQELKHSPARSKERGWLGITGGFGGVFFCGRGRFLTKTHDFLKNGYNNLMRLVPEIQGVDYSVKSYDELSPRNSLIYCDPPYRGNRLMTEFFQGFDHDKFWNIMRKWSSPELNNIVVISELNAPSDFKEVWSSEYRACHQRKFADKKKNKAYDRKFIEKLFMYRPGLTLPLPDTGPESDSCYPALL